MMEDPGIISGTMVFIVLTALGYCALSATAKHRETLPFQRRLFFIAAVLRFVLSVVIYQPGLIHILKDEDASGWVIGGALRERWLGGGVGLLDLSEMLGEAFGGRHRGYYYLLGVLFYLTDSPTRLVAAALNCVLGGLTVVFA